MRWYAERVRHAGAGDTRFGSAMTFIEDPEMLNGFSAAFPAARPTGGLIAGVLLLIGVASACNPNGEGSGDTTRPTPDSAKPTGAAQEASSAGTTAAHRAHCRAHAEAIRDSVSRRSFEADCQERAQSAMRASAAFTLAGEMMLTIPEYHDEQAFPTGPASYGPVVVFYASPYLGTFRFDWQIAEHGERGILAAVLDVKTNTGPLPDPYTKLGLEPGLNCLWLALDNTEWKAYVSQTPPKTACDPNPANRKQLAVTRSPNELVYTKDDYPAVTRFTEAAIDPAGNLGTTAGQPLLSVSCIGRWCEIGPQQTGGAADFHVGKPIGAAASVREQRIKGWHDEQWLAIKNNSGDLVPGFRATFVPEKKINEKNAAAFKPPAWVPVATVHLSADPPAGSKYAKLGLRKGKNQLHVQGQGTTWTGYWLNAGTKSQEFKVDRVSHFDAAVPGTARFRWQPDDDSMWAPCGQACCRVEPIM